MIEKKILSLNFQVKPDIWLSEVLGYKSGQIVKRNKTSNKIKKQNLTFLYAKISTKDLKLVSKLCEIGFLPIDTALQFKGNLRNEPKKNRKIRIRFAEKEDENELCKIAMKNFLYSRFHLDPMIPNPVANKLKACWVKNFFLGNRGDEMIVAEMEKKICGFLLLVNNMNMNLIIDLICVDRKFHKKGIAKMMIHFAKNKLNFNKTNKQKLVVGTQLLNIPSIKLYQSLGLKIISSQFILHYHKPIRNQI